MANSTIQLQPLADRLNANQQARRQRRITARATVAEALARNAQGQNLAIAFMAQRVRLLGWLLLAQFIAFVIFQVALAVFGR